MQKNLAKSCIKACKELSKKFPSKTIIVNNKIEKQKVVILLIKINSKIYKLKSYNKIINHSIYGHR